MKQKIPQRAFRSISEGAQQVLSTAPETYKKAMGEYFDSIDMMVVEDIRKADDSDALVRYQILLQVTQGLRNVLTTGG